MFRTDEYEIFFKYILAIQTTIKEPTACNYKSDRPKVNFQDT